MVFRKYFTCIGTGVQGPQHQGQQERSGRSTGKQRRRPDPRRRRRQTGHSGDLPDVGAQQLGDSAGGARQGRGARRKRERGTVGAYGTTIKKLVILAQISHGTEY